MNRPPEPIRLAPVDVLRLGLLGITARRMRAVLSALGISIGIATMVVVAGIPASSQRDLADQLSALGTNLLRVQPVPDQKPPVLLPENSVAMVERIGPVLATSAVANTHAVVRRSDLVDPHDTSGLTVLAARGDLLETVNGRVRSGRFLGADEQFPTVVLGYVAASRLGVALVPGQPLPQVSIDDHWFSVVGVLDPMPLAPDLERSALVGWEPARGVLGFDGHPTVVYVRAREEALNDVRGVLPATLDPQLPGLVQVSRPSDALAAKQATETAFAGLFLGLAGVALLVGGVGVANTMLISVLERRREIGLRRALGANRGQIRAQFLTESVLLSLSGGAAGTVLGVLATVGYAGYQGWPAVVPVASVAVGIGAALLVGVAAGVYPAVRAARLTPTEALATS
ncbi:ABC transporter permease [Asanoa ishikariensis]|uniref:Putative ABC transport system permease protein n=1 Tax=Asanoa ishikariensis TaxID=137265 RepID=A0A1H3S8H7_9ACTN|nr:ABC transporter permease [Asanoa ishikariensis]GIF70339.1 ABC transporter permease [Asanoa ishikariensis]SDZ33885.1 putative ABC transport system permease protein [Asanoa ishikariensis]